MTVALRLVSAAALFVIGAYAIHVGRTRELLRRQAKAQVRFWHRRPDLLNEARIDDTMDTNGWLHLVVGGMCLFGGVSLVISTLLGAR